MAFPTTSVLDTFTGADETPITTNWTAPAGSGDTGANLTSNQLGGGSGFHSAYYDLATYGPDFEGFATMATLPGTSEDMEVRCCTLNAGVWDDGYGCRITGGATFTMTLRRIDNGSSTAIATQGSLSISAGDKLGLEKSGSNIRGYLFQSGSWSLILDQADATYNNSGIAIGLLMNGGSPRFDDFGGGTIVAAAGPPLIVVTTPQRW